MPGKSECLTRATLARQAAVEYAPCIHDHSQHDSPDDTGGMSIRVMGSVLRDRFVWDAYESRDPKFGYNNPGYYVVENSVRALDQIAFERLGVARPLSDRFFTEFSEEPPR